MSTSWESPAKRRAEGKDNSLGVAALAIALLGFFLFGHGDPLNWRGIICLALGLPLFFAAQPIERWYDRRKRGALR